MHITFFVTLGFCLLFLALASPLYGAIYSWTDENGIMHFTNYNPPPEARVFIKDIKRPRHEEETDQANQIKPGQSSSKQLEIQENLEEKLDEANQRIDEFARSLEDAEVLNQSLERKLRAANQKAEEALEYAEELGDKIREITSPPSSEYDYFRTVGYYPISIGYRYPYKVHKPRFRHKRSHQKGFIGQKLFTIPHGVGLLQKRSFGSTHVGKSPGIGVRLNTRFGHRQLIR